MDHQSDARITGIYQDLEEQERRASDLWRMVVAQGIRDLDLGLGRVRERNPESEEIQLDALRWLTSPDFKDCCFLALIDPDELYDRLKEILQMKPPYRRLMLRDLAEMIRDQPLVPEPVEASLPGSSGGRAKPK